MTDQETERSLAAEKPISQKATKRREKTDKDRHGKRKEREAEAERTLVAELDRLRAIVREVATRYLELLESEIAQIRETVLSSDSSSDRLARLTTMARALENLSVKPQKGRRKDLKRIEGLVAILNKVAQKL